MESQRSQYRVRQGAGAMRVTLRTESSPGAAALAHEGDVLNLTIQGLGGRFPEHGMPAVMPGERVRLELCTLLLIEPLVAEAVVRCIDASAGDLLIGFEFTDPREVARLVPFVLRPLFNRRRFGRAQVDEHVEVELSAPGLAIQGRLRQISVGGAGVAVPLELAARLARGERLALRTRLPGRDTQLELCGQVRGLWRDGDALGCSLRFDPEGTPDFARQRSVIRAFVAERRAAADREGSQA